VAFADADYALLVGAMPRKAGMERSDLLSANGGIFKPQGKALSDNASRDVKVLVVGNPANTNALIAMSNAPDLDPRQFTAMVRLDHNRAISQIAEAGHHGRRREHMTIWGNHSTTQYPDLFHATVNGKNAAEAVGDLAWIENTFIPTVAKRGAAVIEARGASSAASAASAAIGHMRSWGLGTGRRLVSMAVPSDGATACPRASSRASCHRRRRQVLRSSRASTSTSSAGPGSMPRSPSSSRARRRQGARPRLSASSAERRVMRGAEARQVQCRSEVHGAEPRHF
jgi:malate dehydrogenase